MFSTLRYNKATQAVQLSEPRPSRGACTNCRTRKLRCSGQRTGCDRCKSRKIACEYPEPVKRKGPHHKSQSQSQEARPERTSPDQTASKSNMERPNSATATSDKPNPPSSEASSIPSLEWDDAVHAFDPLDTNFDMVAMDGLVGVLDPDLDLDLDMDMGTIDADGFDMSNGLETFDLCQFSGTESDSLASPFQATANISSEAITLQEQPDMTSPAHSRKTSIGTSHHSQLDMTMLNRRRPTTSSSMSTGSSACQCLTNVSCLLETLSIETAQLNLSRIGRLLHLQKRILNQGNVLLGCPSCSGLSHYISLIIILCENLANSFGQMLTILTDQYLQLQARHNPEIQHNSHGIGRLLPAEPEDEEQRIVVQDYDIDVEEEPCVFGALSLIQLKKLRALLVRIKYQARDWKWDSHIKIIESTEEKVTKDIHKYDKNQGYAIKERSMVFGINIDS